MHRWALITAAMIVFASFGVKAQDIVLNDIANSAATSHIFSETCSSGRKYSLETSSLADHRQVIMHYGSNVRRVSSKNLLSMIAGFDLYSVRMGCGHTNGLFFVALRKENGNLFQQTLSIDDEGSVKVEPIRMRKSLGRSR